MDISELKNIVKKLGFLKEYSSLLVPLLIAAVGVLVFMFSFAMSNKVREQIASQSVSQLGGKVRSLSGNAVARDQWKVEQEYQRSYEADANQIVLLARQTAQRELLSYKIFPAPKDTSPLIFEEFGRQFCSNMDRLVAGVNARDCPTNAELNRDSPKSDSSGPQGGINAAKSLRRDADNAIVDALCRERAESVLVYINSVNLGGYEFWAKQKDESSKVASYEYVGITEAVQDCWYSQLAYWIIEDVINTIYTVNTGSKNVFTSPAKRLMTVSFTRPGGGSQLKVKSRKTSSDNMPSYVLSAKDALTTPCTGRLCNNDIDVVHFAVSVVVDARAVPLFMQQLCSAKQHKFKGFFGQAPEKTYLHNQITILESSFESFDMKTKTHELYRYGDDAVVKLDMICEYIFDKSGYDEIKPKSVNESQSTPAGGR